MHDSTWSPQWTVADIQSAGAQVRRMLQQGPYAELSARARARCGDAGFWQRQFDITKRAACAQLGSIESKLRYHERDAWRVLQRVKSHWAVYLQKVRSVRGVAGGLEVEQHATASPAQLYYFLVTDQISRAWLRHQPNMEASNLSAWSKIGRDNQFLWDYNQFEELRQVD
jgi:hypothetical protein